MAVYSIPQAMPTLNARWQRLALAVDKLYGKVSDQHLHRLLFAMAHLEATLKLYCKPAVTGEE